MKKSAFHHYNPSDHAEQYGWLWVDKPDDEGTWHLVLTVERDDDLRLLFLRSGRDVSPDAYFGQPFFRVSPPPSDGTNAPSFVLTLDTDTGAQMMFTWAAEGAGDEFGQIIKTAVERAIAGATKDQNAKAELKAGDP